MNDLLQTAVDAHGGLERWNQINSIQLAASITGEIWKIKGQEGYLNNVVMNIDTRRERMVTDFPGQDKRITFEPHQLLMERKDGTMLQKRDDPESSFAGQQLLTPWDDLHVAYFQGEALWTYLNTPFLYTQEGFVTEEIASIQVDGETWRRLKVIFPDHIKSHTKQQISCFGEDGLLRRHDYTVDILGGATGLNYASDYRNIEGIMIPTKRRIYAYEGNYQRVPEPLLVKIDMGAITLH
jgi:hypothetical protein